MNSMTSAGELTDDGVRDDGPVAADDYCYLTTTGRRSGRPHRIEIWYAARTTRCTCWRAAAAPQTGFRTSWTTRP